MRVKRILAVILCMLLMFASGCKKISKVEDKPKDELEGNLVIWSSRDNLDMLRLSADNYKKLHSMVNINVVEVNDDKFIEKLQVSDTSQENLPDILCIGDEYVQELLSKHAGIFEDTGDDLKKENFLKYKIDNLTFDGKLYGFPVSLNPAVMVFRSEMLEKGSVKLEYVKTWQDYIDLNLSSALPFEDEKFYRALLNQLGGSYFNKEGKPEINSRNTLRAAEELIKLHSSKAVKDAKSFEEVSGLLKKGEIDSALIGTQELSKIYRELPELKSKLQVAKPPAFEYGGNQAINLGGSNLILINTSKKKNIAIDFSKFSSENHENLKAEISELGLVPAYTYYYDEKGFADKMLLRLAKEIYPINYTSNFSNIKENIRLAISNIILQQKDADIIFDELQKNLSIQAK